MKIAHIADIHLRESHYGHTSRSNDFCIGALNAISAAAEAGCKYIICCGDMFDTNRLAPSVILTHLDRIHAHLKKLNLTMFVSSGNHDDLVPHWSTRFEEMDEDSCIKFIDNETVEVGPPAPHQITIRALPCMHPSEFVAALRQPENKATIIMWHGEIKEFCGYPKPGAVEMSDVEAAGACQLLAMGHIHEHVVKRTDSGIYVAYPGSTEFCSSDEDAQKHILVWEFTENGEIAGYESVPFKTRTVHRFDIETEEDLEKAEKEITPGSIALVKFRKGILNVRQRLTDAVQAKDPNARPVLFKITSVSVKKDKVVNPIVTPGKKLRNCRQFVADNKDRFFADSDDKEDLVELSINLLDPTAEPKVAIDKFCKKRMNGRTSV